MQRLKAFVGLFQQDDDAQIENGEQEEGNYFEYGERDREVEAMVVFELFDDHHSLGNDHRRDIREKIRRIVGAHSDLGIAEKIHGQSKYEDQSEQDGDG